jgi:hypothetical protein
MWSQQMNWESEELPQQQPHIDIKELAKLKVANYFREISNKRFMATLEQQISTFTQRETTSTNSNRIH